MCLIIVCYYILLGWLIQLLGIQLDIIVEQLLLSNDEEEVDEGFQFWFEVDLCGVLDNDSLIEDEICQIEEDVVCVEVIVVLCEEDYQLVYVIDLFKGLKVLVDC